MVAAVNYHSSGSLLYRRVLSNGNGFMACALVQGCDSK